MSILDLPQELYQDVIGAFLSLEDLYYLDKDLLVIESARRPREAIQLALKIDEPFLLSLVDYVPLDLMEQAIKMQSKEILRYLLKQGYVDEMWDVYAGMREPWSMDAIGDLLLEDDEIFDILEGQEHNMFEQQYFQDYPNKLPEYLDKVRQRGWKISCLAMESAGGIFFSKL